jgi:hypothetical protein
MTGEALTRPVRSRCSYRASIMMEKSLRGRSEGSDDDSANLDSELEWISSLFLAEKGTQEGTDELVLLTPCGAGPFWVGWLSSKLKCTLYLRTRARK